MRVLKKAIPYVLQAAALLLLAFLHFLQRQHMLGRHFWRNSCCILACRQADLRQGKFNVSDIWHVQQAREVMDAMQKDAHFSQIQLLKVDGGASNNNFLMQMQADALQVQQCCNTLTPTLASVITAVAT